MARRAPPYGVQQGSCSSDDDLSDLRITVGETAGPVVLLLKSVGIDRAVWKHLAS